MVYLIVLLLTIFFSFFTTEKNKKIQIIIIMGFLTLIAGFRHYSIGPDTVSYLKYFRQILFYGSSIIESSRLEIGYNYLMLFISKFTSNFNIFLLICSAFINYSIGHLIYKYSKKPMYSIILFIFLNYFFSEMNILREYLALGIVLCSIDSILDRKLIKFLLLVLLASLFHTSAFMAIPLFFICNNEFSKKTKIILLIITAAIYSYLGSILITITTYIGVYSNYVTDRLDSNNLASLLSFFVNISIYLFYSYEYEKNCEKMGKKNNSQGAFLKNVSFVAVLLSLISYKINIFNRTAVYYNISNIILVPNAISMIKNNNNKRICSVVIFLLFFLHFFIILLLRPEWYQVLPYKFYWS